MAITEVDRPALFPEGDLPSERELYRMEQGRAEPRPAPSSGGGHLPYFPALDGLRGLAVISVLFFHAGFSWAVGGYLGVSTFFTLSGFLITSLLLAENTATGHIRLGAFWIRRFRRLMPAAIAAMALAIVVAIFTDPVARANIGGDIGSAVGYVANWRFVFSGKSYAELFSSPSVVQHFWSLAIEEQFYLIYPLLAYGILKIAKGRRAMFGWILGLLTAASVALPLFFGFSHDRIYYGTDARAAELLMGAMLAVALYYRPITNALAGSARVQRTMAAVGALALTGCVVMWATIEQQSNPLYLGGFFGYSILTVLVIIATLLPVGPVASLLSTSPMRWMGKISYGVYLYHWPIFLFVSEERVPLSGLPLFVVRIALTLAVAVVSYHYLETPIRKGEPLFGRSLRIRPVRIAPIALAVLVVAAIIVGLTAPPPQIDFEVAKKELKFSDAPPPVFDPTSSTPPHPRIAMFGDSTALETAFGLNQHLTMTGKGDLVEGVTELGCSFIRGGWLMNRDGMGKNSPLCDQWDKTFSQKLVEQKPNIAIIQDGPWEVIDHQFANEPNKWYHVGDPKFDEVMLKEMTGVVDLMAANGAQVFWLTLPRMGAPKGMDPRRYRGDGADPARAQRFNELINQLPQLRPGKVKVVDLAGWLAKSGDDERLRTDGVHFSPETAREVSEKWLADAIIEQYKADWIAARKAEFDTKQAGLTPIKALVVGDSAGINLSLGLGKVGSDTKTLNVGSEAQLGCGIGRGGSRKNHDRAEAVPAECQTWEKDWAAKIEQDKPDVTVVVNGMWDVADRQLDGDDTWRGPGDPTYDRYLAGEFGKAADTLHRRGQPVIWLTYPPIDLGLDDAQNRPYSTDDPARVARMNEIVREVAKTRPWLKVADLAEYTKGFPGGQLDPTMRADGVHFTADTAEKVSRDWLAQQVLDVVRDYRLALAAASNTTPLPVPTLPRK